MPILLTACGGGNFDTRESTGLVLPSIVQYDSETLSQAADEIEGALCPALTELAKDYKLTRDRIRLAQSELGN